MLKSIQFVAILSAGLLGCKKLVDVPQPVNILNTVQAFSTDDQALSVMAGIYSNMINANGNLTFDNGILTLLGGLSADEFISYDQNFNDGFSQFQDNQVVNNNGLVLGDMWQPAYSTVYQCNAAISGLNASTGVHDSLKSELIGEAEFVRALQYFNLANCFGGVPLALTIDYNKTSTLPRSSVPDVYAQVIIDLKDAQLRLRRDDSSSQGQRLFPNHWAATALLARVYLYQGDWADALAQSDSVLANTSEYALAGDPNSAFLPGSPEVIWQMAQNSNAGTQNAVPEGHWFIPGATGGRALTYLTPTLLSAFEAGDLRWTDWVDSTDYLGTVYYYPFKYQLGLGNVTSGGQDPQYYVVLRLAEQILIHAEAEANGTPAGLSAAIADLNRLRSRAGLSGTTATSQTQVLAAIVHERQIELFAEWGHRWFDLRRWGMATNVLSAEKGVTVTTDALVFPLPITDLTTDPNLTQNPGY